jgi:hypothetical protein
LPKKKQKLQKKNIFHAFTLISVIFINFYYFKCYYFSSFLFFGQSREKRDKNNNNNKENKIKNMQLGIKLKEIIKKNGYNWQKNKMNLETKL